MAERRKVGNYELLEKIGAGGMGAVFKARQVAMDRIVALKILPPSLAKKPTFIERFMREARASAKLNHPNIVNGIDVGNDAGLYYFAMEYIEGDSLRKIIERDDRLSEKRTMEISVAIAHALEHAHSHGILHRDIKPDNIIVDKEGTAKLCDLGLAHLAAEPDMEGGPDKKRTAVGTPHYISPEQARGEEDLDATTDLYSMGATIYHMLTGVTMFQGTTSAKIMSKHLYEKPPNPAEFEVNISKGLLSILARLLAKNRADRYTSAAKLAQDLERVAAGEAPQYANLPAEKWPFKTGGPATEPPTAARKSAPTVSIDVRPKRLRGSRSGIEAGAFVLVGMVVLGFVGLLLVKGSGDESNRTERKARVTEVEPPPVRSESPVAYAPPVEKPVAKTSEKPVSEKPFDHVDPVGLSALSEKTDAPLISVATGNVDPAPALEAPHPAKPKVAMPALLADVRKTMDAGKFAEVQNALVSIRSDFANSDELREYLGEINDLDIRAKAALSATVEDGNVALATNGTSVRGAQQFLSMLDGKLDCTKFTGFAFQSTPCDWVITLRKTYLLREIRLLLYDLDARSYQYSLEIAGDDQKYSSVDDKTSSQARSWQFAAFAPTPVKFIRIKGKANSAGPNFQVVELEAYCHPSERPETPRQHPAEPEPKPLTVVAPPPTPVAPPTPVVQVKPDADAADKPKGTTVDLLKMVQNRNTSDWDFDDGAMVNRGTSAKNQGKGKNKAQTSNVDFPYTPPEEYDYTVEFSIEEPAPPSMGLVLQGVPMNSRSLIWAMPAAPDSWFGFDMIGGLRYTESANPTHRSINKGVSISAKHKSTIQVRRDTLTVLLDGNKLMVWHRDGTSPNKDSQYYKGNNSNYLNIGAANKVSVKVYSAEVLEISGSGEKK